MWVRTPWRKERSIGVSVGASALSSRGPVGSREPGEVVGDILDRAGCTEICVCAPLPPDVHDEGAK